MRIRTRGVAGAIVAALPASAPAAAEVKVIRKSGTFFNRPGATLADAPG